MLVNMTDFDVVLGVFAYILSGACYFSAINSPLCRHSYDSSVPCRQMPLHIRSF